MQFPPLWPIQEHNLKRWWLFEELPYQSQVFPPCPSGVDAVVPYLSEILVMDVDNEPGNKLLYGHPRESGRSLGLVFVLEGDVLPVVLFNSALGKDWTFGIPADVLGREPRVAQPYSHPDVPGLLVERVPEGTERTILSPSEGIPILL